MFRFLAAAALSFFALASNASEWAVMIYPRERPWFRRIFYTRHQRDLRETLARRFQLVVHEQVATDDDVLGIDVRGAKLLVLSAHGSQTAMFFGRSSDHALDGTDLERLRGFFSQLHPEATIVLQSCNTGKGFAWAVKEAAGPGRTVIAAKGTVPAKGLTIPSLDPLAVDIRCRGDRGPWDCRIEL